MRVSGSLPLVDGVDIRFDREVESFYVIVGDWSVSLYGDDLIVRDSRGPGSDQPLLKVPAMKDRP